MRIFLKENDVCESCNDHDDWNRWHSHHYTSTHWLWLYLYFAIFISWYCITRPELSLSVYIFNIQFKICNCSCLDIEDGVVQFIYPSISLSIWELCIYSIFLKHNRKMSHHQVTLLLQSLLICDTKKVSDLVLCTLQQRGILFYTCQSVSMLVSHTLCKLRT